MSSQNKNNKKVAAQRLISELNAEKILQRDMSHLDQIAETIVDPRRGPLVFPSRAPGRTGCATFPLVKRIQSSSLAPTPDMGVICRPSFDRPLMISRPNSVPYSSDTITGRLTKEFGGGAVLEGLLPCNVIGETLDGYPANPLKTLTASATIQWSYDCTLYGPTLWQLDFMAFDGSAWTWLDSQPVYAGATAGITSSKAWTLNYTQYSIRAYRVAGPDSTLVCNFSLKPSVGTFSCSPSYDERVMDTFYPDWVGLLGDAKKARIVACDMLVTYEGSTFKNSGSIAIANADTDIVLDSGQSIYESVASRPFDKYRGRLASEGSAEGGAHWHFVPETDEEFLISDIGLPGPQGICGISGIDEDQVIRIECHYCVNFYSELPQYKMVIPPPITGYSPLLWLLRSEIPLVSSNDTHQIVKSLRKGLRKGGKMGLNAATDPRVLKALSLLSLL